MVQYCFDIKNSSADRGSEQINSELMKISWFTVMWYCIVPVLQMLIILYVQTLFFNQNISDNSGYYVNLIIYLVAAIICMCFSGRIYILNKEKHFCTLIVVTGIFLLFNVIMPVYMEQMQDHDIGMIMFKFTATTVFLFFQIPTFLCHIIVAKRIIQFKHAQWNNDENKQIIYFHHYINALANASLVKILDCFLRAAPQQIVQFTKIFHNHGDIFAISIIDQISILIAFITVPWTMTSFQQILRIQHQNYDISWMTKAIYWIWQYFILVSRIIAFSAALPFCPITTGVVILLHWLSATIWLFYNVDLLAFYNYNIWYHGLFCAVFGIVYIFTPCIHLEKHPKTWSKFVGFFGGSFFEYLVIYAIYFAFEGYTTIVTIVFLTFGIGLIVMLVYYENFHPTRKHNEITEPFAEDDV